jgi:hypothetical protein
MIDVFRTHFLIGVVEELVPRQTFFRDRYFPTGAGDIFSSDKVLAEYRDGDRGVAPFVVRRAGDIPIARGGYQVREYEPPYIAPSLLLTLDELSKRGFGEALYSNTTPAQRAVNLISQDFSTLDERISRRIEWMAAQTIINNGFTATAYIDNGTDGEVFDVFYYDTAKSNPALYTVGAQWDQPGGDFWQDIEAMCALLSERGLPASDLVLGPDAWAYIQSDEKVMKFLDNRRMEYGGIAPSIAYPGVARAGRINFNGFDLEIFVVRETFADEAGASQRQFPGDAALVTAPGCGHTMYGQVTQIEQSDGQFHSYAEPRVPKLTVDADHDIRKLRLASRPLTAPRVKAPWIYAPGVVS